MQENGEDIKWFFSENILHFKSLLPSVGAVVVVIIF